MKKYFISGPFGLLPYPTGLVWRCGFQLCSRNRERDADNPVCNVQEITSKTESRRTMGLLFPL